MKIQDTSEKQITTKLIKQNINSKNYEKLVSLIPAGVEFGCSKTLLKKSWFLAGEYQLQKGDNLKAIMAFNKSRVLDKSNPKCFSNLILSFSAFYEQWKEKFSKLDLTKLKEPIEIIIYYQKLHFSKQEKAIKEGEDLLIKIEYRKKYLAKDTVETPASFKVQEIHDALYGDMTMEEVRAEFARLLEPTLREMLEEKEKTKKKKKKQNKEKKKK